MASNVICMASYVSLFGTETSIESGWVSLVCVLRSPLLVKKLKKQKIVKLSEQFHNSIYKS